MGTPLGDRKMDFEVEITTHSEGGTGRDQDRPVCPYIIYIGEGRDGSPHLLGLWCQLGGGLPQQHCTGCPCAKRCRTCRPTPACLTLGGWGAPSQAPHATSPRIPHGRISLQDFVTTSLRLRRTTFRGSGINYHALMQHKFFCKISFDHNHAASIISFIIMIIIIEHRS